jgi:hypothetical protein
MIFSGFGADSARAYEALRALIYQFGDNCLGGERRRALRRAAGGIC